jgi:glycerophosphoryl diester phosphodiesterase
VWTVNDVSEMQGLLDRGVDGIMSDDIDALSAVFGTSLSS